MGRSKGKVLITSGAWQAAIACTQSLGRKGIDVFFIDQQAKNFPIAHSRYCKGAIESPNEKNEEEYVYFLTEHLKQHKYDLLIPISDYVMRYAVKNQTEWQKHIRLLLPSKDSVDIASSKEKTGRFALKNNIPIPETFFPINIEEVLKLSEKDIYPCVVKIPISVASQGVFVIQDKNQLLKLYQQQKFDNQWPIIQRFFQGTFFGVTAVVHNGKILSFFQFKSLLERTEGGTQPLAVSCNEEDLQACTAQIVKLLNWTGGIDLDFIKNKNGQFVLLEINPRFSGTLNFAYKLGVDLAWDYWNLSQGKPLTLACNKYPKDVLFRSILPTEILFVLNNKGYWATFLKNLFNWKAKSNLYIDDIGLIIQQMRETYWHWHDLKKKRKQKT